MPGRIAVNDLRLLVAEKRLQGALAAVVLGVALALAGGIDWYAERQAEVERVEAELDAQHERMRAQIAALERGEQTPAELPAAGLPNVVSTGLVLPPAPLAALAVGQSDLHPFRANVAAAARADDMFRFYQIENPVNLLSGRFDLAFFVVFLLPLVLITLNYNVLSAERESGALALLLSQPVTAARLAWTRLAMRAAIVWGALALVVVATLIGWWLAGGPRPDGARLAGVLIALAAYVAFWTALIGWVSAAGRGSDHNATVLVVAWLALVLVVPTAANLLVERVSPMPSRMAYVVESRAAANRANAQSRELLQGYLLDHPEIEAREGGAVAPFIKTFYLTQRAIEAELAPVTRAFETRLEAQQAWAARLRLLSPALMVQTVMNDAAGADLERQQRFRAQARELRRAFLAAVEPRLMAGERLSLADFDALPRSVYAPAPAADSLWRALATAGVLGAYALVLVVLAARRFRRFPLTG